MRVGSVMGLLCFLFSCFSSCLGQHLDFKYVTEHGTLWEKYLPDMVMLESFQEDIAISETINLSLQIDVSPHGNGSMKVGNVKLHIYSTQPTAYYEDRMLSVDFIDINADGLKEMLIHGLVNYTGERHEDIFERESVLFIYTYSAQNKKFVLSHQQASFDLEEESGNLSWIDRYNTQHKYASFRELDALWSSENKKGHRVDLRFKVKQENQ